MENLDTLSITEVSETPVLNVMEEVPENPPGKNLPVEAGTAETAKGLVIQKNYVLNDTAALKKKMRNETRKEPYNLGTEARNGSSMTIEMKTSFFE